MKNENYIDQNLQNSFENFLMKSANISQEEAVNQIAEIQSNAMNLVNSQDPEIQRRLDLIEEIDPQELNDELQYLISELSTNNYSAEDQMEISNALFNIFGFNIDLNDDNQVQINLVEPTIDNLEYEDEGYEDMPMPETLSSDNNQMNMPANAGASLSDPISSMNEGVFDNRAQNASTTNQYKVNTGLKNKNLDYDDFDY